MSEPIETWLPVPRAQYDAVRDNESLLRLLEAERALADRLAEAIHALATQWEGVPDSMVQLAASHLRSILAAYRAARGEP